MNKITNIFEEYLAKEFRKDKEFYRDDFDEKEWYGVEDFDQYLQRVDIDYKDYFKNLYKEALKNCKGK